MHGLRQCASFGLPVGGSAREVLLTAAGWDDPPHGRNGSLGDSPASAPRDAAFDRQKGRWTMSERSRDAAHALAKALRDILTAFEAGGIWDIHGEAFRDAREALAKAERALSGAEIRDADLYDTALARCGELTTDGYTCDRPLGHAD